MIRRTVDTPQAVERLGWIAQRDLAPACSTWRSTCVEREELDRVLSLLIEEQMMETKVADQMIREFEQGTLSRRELAARLMGLGAAVAASQGVLAAEAEPAQASSTFETTSLDHVALNVTDVACSRDFYAKHLGLKLVGGDGKSRAFMAPQQETGFVLALFPAESAGLNHYAYAIQNYQPDQVVEKLKAENLSPRREQNRIYFDDPDGITVQVTGS